MSGIRSDQDNNMLESKIADSVVDHALSLGADFAELFVDRNQVNNIATLSNEVQSVQSGIDFGIGIRLVYGYKVLYGYTNKSSLSTTENTRNTIPHQTFYPLMPASTAKSLIFWQQTKQRVLQAT
jgi:predicted Zn-dependent protease